MKLNKISSVVNVNKFAKTNVALFGATLTAMLAMPTYAAEEAAAPEAKEDIEVIQVTGMLGSMKAAAVLKRSDGRIVDAIVAEDIGKLPDNNIAEALSRITGVSVNSDFGVGSGVSIRGLSENRVELNGRSTIGDSRDGISLEDYPSSFLKTVEVVKSPTADMIEGALGGTVSMKTVRPLELEKLTGAMSLDAEYADKTENWAPIFSGSIGNNWDMGSAGSFGAMAMLSYQDREIRQDEFISRVKPVEGEVSANLPDAGGNTPSGNYTLRDQHTVEQYVEERERTAVNLGLQWAPESGDGMVYLDISGTQRSGNQAGNSILAVGGGLEADTHTSQGPGGALNNYNLNNEFAIPKTYSDFRETTSFSNAIGTEWNITEKIMISGELAIASSSSERPDSEFTLRPIDHAIYDADGSLTNHTYTGDFNQSGDKLPSIVHSSPDAYTNAQYLALRTFKAEQKNTENDETALRIDVVFDEPIAAADWLTTVKTGIRATQREYHYEQFKEEVKDIYKNAYVADASGDSTGERATIWIDEYNEAYPGSFTTLSHANSFDQVGQSGQNDLLTFANYNGLSNASNTYAQLQSLLAGTTMATEGSLKDNQEFQNSAFRDISEDTAALYVSAYLDFDRLTAIVGGRYITTSLESSVYLNDELVSGTNDYNDFLPSLNMSYSLTDDTVLRLAAAKVMRRADFNQLSPAFDVDNSIVTATQGSIGLDPHRATQFDLSAEHYFGEGNMVSFALYYKDVESFLATSQSCVADASTSGTNVTEWESVCLLNAVGETNLDMVYGQQSDYADNAAGEAATASLRDAGLTGIDTSKDTNGENGKVQGFELGYQQHFSELPGAFSGLGISANYTYADSEQPNGNPLLNISENTFNLQTFWEYEEFSVRLAYNYRDEFLESESEKRIVAINDTAENGIEDSKYGNNYRDARGQLDFSASWDINEHFTVVGNASNITGEASVYKDDLGNSWKYTEADRRYTIGVRAKF